MNKADTKIIPYLDGWRGLAIVLVLWAHFVGPSWIGPFGVLLFFVLSGFLMSNLLFIKQVELKDFFVRRFSRIVPTFWLFTLAMVAYANVWQPTFYQPPFSEVVATLTFLRTYLPSGLDIGARQWPIGHLWSLNVEEHSYIYLAVVALVCRQFKNKPALIAILFASVATALFLNFYYATHPPHVASRWSVLSECASLGLLAAAAIRICRENTSVTLIKSVSPLLPVLTFIVAIACFSTYSHKGVDMTVAPLCLAFTINYLDQVPVRVRALLSSAALRWFGVCSFSLYLWQQPFYYLMGKQTFNGVAIPSLILGAGAVCAGALSFYLFENPLRLYINRAWSEREQRRAPILLAPSSLEKSLP